LKFQFEFLGLVDITVEFWSIKCYRNKGASSIELVSILTMQ